MQNPLLLKKFSSSVQKERMEQAQKLRKAHMEKWIIEHYKKGVSTANIGKGYKISSTKAYIFAKKATKEDPQLALARTLIKGRRKVVPIVKQKIRKTRIKEFGFKERRKFEQFRIFDVKKLLRHVSIDEYSASASSESAGVKESAGIVQAKGAIRQVSTGTRKTNEEIEENKTKNYRARIEATKFLLQDAKGMRSYYEITQHLLPTGLVRNKAVVTNIMLELVEMGAVDRVPPKGYRIRDEWVKAPQKLRPSY
ncbi:MAG: hypothetical protein WC821_00870 [archaeon]|jgi:hypothetical protein